MPVRKTLFKQPVHVSVGKLHKGKRVLFVGQWLFPAKHPLLITVLLMESWWQVNLVSFETFQIVSDFVHFWHSLWRCLRNLCLKPLPWSECQLLQLINLFFGQFQYSLTHNHTKIKSSPSLSLTPRNITTVQMTNTPPITPAAIVYTCFCREKETYSHVSI